MSSDADQEIEKDGFKESTVGRDEEEVKRASLHFKKMQLRRCKDWLVGKGGRGYVASTTGNSRGDEDK